MEKRKRKAHRIKTEYNLCLNALICGGVGLASAFAAAMLSPLLLLSMGDPKGFVMPIVGICAFIGGAAAGVTGAKTCKGKEVPAALIAAAMMIAAMLLLSFGVKKGFDILGFAIVAMLIAVGSFLGSYFTLKAISDKKRGMKKAMKRR